MKSAGLVHDNVDNVPDAPSPYVHVLTGSLGPDLSIQERDTQSTIASLSDRRSNIISSKPFSTCVAVATRLAIVLPY